MKWESIRNGAGAACKFISKLDPGPILQWVQIVGIFVGAVWVFVTFQIPRWEEARRPPHLILSAQLEKMGIRDALITVKARVTIQNRSGRSVYVPFSLLTVEGIRIKPIQFAQDNEKRFDNQLQHRFTDTRPDGVLVWHPPWLVLRHSWEAESAVAIARGQLLSGTWVFHTNEDWSHETLVHVPVNLYHVVRLRVEVFASKDKKEGSEIAKVSATVRSGNGPHMTQAEEKDVVTTSTVAEIPLYPESIIDKKHDEEPRQAKTVERKP